MIKQVVDIQLIQDIIKRYNIANYIDDTSGRYELLINTLCLELSSLINTQAETVETYQMSVNVNNEFISHMSIDEQNKYKEYLARDMYRKIGDYLYEHECGEFSQTKIDPFTNTFTNNLQVSVIKKDKEN